jgi:hypothetical protein
VNRILNQPPNEGFAEFGFSVEITRDGSPTLRSEFAAGVKNLGAETMHHSGGAAAETWYIYGNVMNLLVQTAIQNKWPKVKVCSIGLGLGYIEICWALLTAKATGQIFQLDSFEVIPELTSSFLNWLNARTQSQNEIYDLMLHKLNTSNSKFVSTETNGLQSYLQEQHQKNFFTHQDVLHYKEKRKWNLICFDAYSKKSGDGLWSQEYLNYFISNHAEQNCIFTTYASTAELKVVLEQNGFQLLNRRGFSGKRESTLAIRGDFKSESFFQTF